VVSSTGSVTNHLKFSGQYQDAEGTGLYYLRARYYSPSDGQFLTVDPAVAKTRSPYAYVSGNPVNATDPSGMCDWYALAVCAVQGVATGVDKAAHWAITGDPNSTFCIRLGGGDWGSNNNGTCETRLSGKQGLIGEGICGSIIAGLGVAAAGAADGAAAGSAEMDALMSQGSRVIAGQGAKSALRDAPRLAAQYGGRAEDWVKMTSTQYRVVDGVNQQVHWYENVAKGLRVEPKWAP
jgi:RHS repeat-associated protein